LDTEPRADPVKLQLDDGCGRCKGIRVRRGISHALQQGFSGNLETQVFLKNWVVENRVRDVIIIFVSRSVAPFL
jgi:hypothetical protein